MRFWIVKQRLVLRRRGLNLYRAGKGGLIPLRGEARWYHVDGVGLNTNRGGFILEFRRGPEVAPRIERLG